jgi:hypothetical protein
MNEDDQLAAANGGAVWLRSKCIVILEVGNVVDGEQTVLQCVEGCFIFGAWFSAMA